MTRGRLYGWSFALLLSLFVLPAPAHAAFHLMKIVEVFPGTEAAPNAQYVVLQMYAGGQNFVAGHSIIVYDASDRVLGTYTFASSVASGANQATILIATTEASAFFGVTADLTMTPVMVRDGGRVCFDTIDCVSWGEYPTAASTGAPFSPDVGLVQGLAMGRRLDVAGGATTLDATDDTNSSVNDFRFRAPSPRNNAGVTGTAPPSTCGDGTLAGLESCDDGNTVDDAVCPGSCILRCGDGIVASPIECEPARTASCSGTCRPIVIAMDGGMPDAGMPDAGEADAGEADAGEADAGGGIDAGDRDAGRLDDAGFDGSIEDAGEFIGDDAAISIDVGLLDAGPVDAGRGDAGADAGRDAGSADAAMIDAARADASSVVVTEGCGCRAGTRSSSTGWTILFAALGLVLLSRRR